MDCALCGKPAPEGSQLCRQCMGDACEVEEEGEEAEPRLIDILLEQADAAYERERDFRAEELARREDESAEVAHP